MDLNSIETPAYILDYQEFIRNIEEFRQALSNHLKNWRLGISVKTNSLPFALKEARKMGCLAEVVSYDEYELAKMCGFSTTDIIYNGPMKSKETFIKAIKGNAVVNLESKRELEWLADLPKDNTFDVGIRVNINISHISPEDADGEDDNSRFGFSDESDEFAQALIFLQSLKNIRLVGLHLHRTTHSRDPRFYFKLIEFAAKIIKKYNLSLHYLDIGGGYFGIFANKPTYNDYAVAIREALEINDLTDIEIIVEPGNALFASAFSFLTSVIDIKRINDSLRFVTTDGSRNDVDPFFRKTDYLKEIFLKNFNRPLEKLQIITGCTCLEYDRLFSLENYPALEIGDRILYKNVGAYTMTLSPLFIRLFPKIFVKTEKDQYYLIRAPWTANNLMQQDLNPSF